MNPSTKTWLGFSDSLITCFVGTLPHEYLTPQEIVISLKIEVSLKGKEDLLENTVDYSALAKLCNELAQSKHHALLETLARTILAEINKRFSPLAMWIRIEKPKALVSTRCAFIEMEQRCPTH
jgi:dihydroneopterin aldolase